MEVVVVVGVVLVAVVAVVVLEGGWEHCGFGGGEVVGCVWCGVVWCGILMMRLV